MDICIYLLLLLLLQDTASFSLYSTYRRVDQTDAVALFASFRDIRDSDEWQGDVVPNGMIQGCSVTQANDSVTDWIIRIDGVEADLGRFSDAIYKKVIFDAQQQRFQGFRPGTVPPHLLKTYRAFTMDECARETVLEAMEQNNIRPFTNAREEIIIDQVSVPPPPPAKKKRNKKKKNAEETKPMLEPWKAWGSMDEAINAGWAPGQSFSFVARNVKGQKVLSDNDVQGAKPLGMR